MPLLITFYLFRPEPRRRLSTTFFLWRRSLPESQGGVYAKRLRSNPLMWLQILALVLLALYLARPATSWSSLVPTSQKIVMVVDRSASMRAGEAFEQAVREAQEGVEALFGFGNLGARPEVMLIAVDREPQILVPFTSDASQLRAALTSLSPTDIPDRLETLRPFLASLVSDQKATVWLFSDHLPPALEIAGLQYTSCGADKAAMNVGVVAFSVEMSSETGTAKPFVYARAQNFSASAEQRLLRVEKMSTDDPEKVESVVMESSLILAAGGGQTVSTGFPANRLSTSQPSLFRATLLPVPNANGSSLDSFASDDAAYTVAPPYGQQRVRVAVTPDLQASFLLRALTATNQVEILDWKRLLAQPDDLPVDLLICGPGEKLPSRPLVRTKFEIVEGKPAADSPVEVLRAGDQALVKEAGAEWSRLRVQRQADWPVAKDETILLSTASGPVLTLKNIGQGQPTLCWRFPLAYSSLPLSPALPVLVSRFVDSYSKPASLALDGSVTTGERPTRPAGAGWSGALEISPGLSDRLASPVQVKAGDQQLPRLSFAGFYRCRNMASDSSTLLAANLFSSSEGSLPRTVEDRSFSKEETAPKAKPDGLQRRQYKESASGLAALVLLVLLLEAALLIQRGRP